MKKEELRELLEERTGPCVSIYMPAEKGSIETKQNPVRFRKLLREAERKLAASAVKPATIKSLAAPAHKLLEDHMFWQYQEGGVAVFLSPKIKRVYTLPLKFTEMAAANGRFCVRQLLPLFAEDARFCVLALSQRSVQLFQCTRYSVGVVDLRRTPKSISQLLEFNHGEKQLQFHSKTEGWAAHGARAGAFHGGAEDTDEEKENILNYFHSINRAVSVLLGGSAGPLVLAGVDYLTRIYKKANTYPQLCEGRLPGSAAGQRPEELRDKAWELVKPGFEEGARAAVRQFGQLQDTPRASNHLKTILRAANEGRVETLFVSVRDQRWGFFDAESGEMDLHRKPDPLDMELLDLCTARTLDQGGKVYALEPERMPGKAPAAAIFRF